MVTLTLLLENVVVAFHSLMCAIINHDMPNTTLGGVFLFLGEGDDLVVKTTKERDCHATT